MPDLSLSPDERRNACVELWERWALAVTENRRVDAAYFLRLRRLLLRPYPIYVTREEEHDILACSRVVADPGDDLPPLPPLPEPED